MRERLKIAVIGATGFHRSEERLHIECFTWSSVSKIQNASDYDVLIINLVSMEDPLRAEWTSFFKAFSEQTTREVLINGGRIVIIGDPRFLVRFAHDTPIGDELVPFLSWTGFDFEWDDRPGSSVSTDERKSETKSYLSYVGKIQHWNYCLKQVHGQSSMIKRISEMERLLVTGRFAEINVQSISWNRYHAPVAFTVQVFIKEPSLEIFTDRAPRITSTGLLVFLPAIDLPDPETITLVLTDIIGLAIKMPEPEWAGQIMAPGQPSIDEDLTDLNNEFQRLTEELNQVKSKREQARKCIRLLYQAGEPLEEVVRETLQALGAKVEPPCEKGKEDGWITVVLKDTAFEAVLEIKGTRKAQFGNDGLRQLMEWKNRGKQLRKKNYKGIFIGSSSIESQVAARPFPFSNDWQESARMAEIAAVQASDLYLLYHLNYLRKLDTGQFWENLFRTNGVFDVSVFTQGHPRIHEQVFGPPGT